LFIIKIHYLRTEVLLLIATSSFVI